jgi:hypothetical protein
MLFERRLREGIHDGRITLAFQRSKRPQVAAGGRYRTGLDLRGSRHLPLYRLGLRRLDEPDPRDELARSDQLDNSAAVADLTRRLDRLGAWTGIVLVAIRDRPGVRAADLADALGTDVTVFKRNVRKLKSLGLTISLERGYRLSPRGAAYLESFEQRAPGN